jgi:hypothetical protein
MSDVLVTEVLWGAGEIREFATGDGEKSYVDVVVPVVLAGQMMLDECLPHEAAAVHQIADGIRRLYTSCAGFPC